MQIPAVLALLLVLPPAAHERNERAMDHDDAGRLAEAELEFVAAYQAMPDPRADLDGREQIVASLRSALDRQHARTGDPAPLCRLRGHLQAHVAALETVFLDRPGPLVLTGNQERLREVERRLAAFPPGTCDPPAPAPAATQPAETAPLAPPPAATTTTSPARPSAVRSLRLAGGLTLALTGAALGVMTYGLVRQHRAITAGRDLDALLAGAPATSEQRAELADLLRDARSGRNLALAAGISSGLFAVAATTLFVLASNKGDKNNNLHTQQNRVLMAPWRLPGGAGLSLRLDLP